MFISKHPFEYRTSIPILIHFIKLVLIEMKVEYINWVEINRVSENKEMILVER
jgi:hypothetical protein